MLQLQIIPFVNVRLNTSKMKKQKRNSAVVLDIKGLLKSRVPYIQSFKQLKQKWITIHPRALKMIFVLNKQ